MKKIFGLLLCLCCLFACSSNKNTVVSSSDFIKDYDSLKVTNVAKMKIKDYGTVVIDLYGEDAPLTVTNFVNLAKDGFYNGSKFHRFVDSFCLQGGASATGKNAQNIPGEFLNNNIKNYIAHTKGVVSLARASDFNSGSSQFFFVLDTSTNVTLSLDSQYAAFGYVREGWDVVEKVCKNCTVTDANGSVSIDTMAEIESVTIE